MADADQADVRDIYRSSILNIPSYQRGYSWESRHVNDLLDDIDYLFEEEQRGQDGDFHYYGTVVLQEQGELEVGTEEFTEYDIVDGQQRLSTIGLLIQCINEKLEDISYDPSEGFSPSDQSDRNTEDYIEFHGHRRLELGNRDDDTYRKLVVQGLEPSSIDPEVPSQQKLVTAKKEILSWLEGYRIDENGNERNDEDYYDVLKTLIAIINTGFEVTKYEVDQTNEAGRIFEAVNDRGRSLTTTERIKSYLIYCAARLGDESLSLHVYEVFGDVVETVTRYGSESDLKRFITEHWRMFSGEHQYKRQSQYEETDLHRRIKVVENHASLARDDDDLTEWIEAYLDSLEESSRAYQEVMQPELIQDRYEGDVADEIDRYLRGVHQCAGKSNTAALLMGSYLEFGVSEDFLQIVKLLEKFSFRAYQVARAQTDVRRSKMRDIAFQVAWTGRANEAADVFGKNAIDIQVYTDSETALNEICRELENAIGNYAPDSQFKDSLLQRDVIDGPDDANWNGFRNKDSIRYFLYEYELYLREGSPEGAFQSLPSFEDWQSQDTGGIQIEHIWAQNPDEELTPEEESEHDTYYQALGNLALLSPGENETGSNMSYADKYEEVYHDSNMAMIRELPSPEDTPWRAEDIQVRGEKLAEFALERWGVETGAYAHVSQLEPDGNEDVVRREVVRHIREDFSGIESLNNLPKVEISDSNLSGSWESVNRCPECGGTQFEASQDESSLNIQCACGESLSSPTYKVQIMDYS